MVRGCFRFTLDHNLCHMSHAELTEYEVYRPYLGGWVAADLDDDITIVPGDILIYRTRETGDRDCHDLARLIRELHAQLCRGSPFEDAIPVPVRYRQIGGPW